MTMSYLLLYHFFFKKIFQASPRALEIIPQLDLGSMPVHDQTLLGHRERVVPCPVDHEPGGKTRQHEGEDDRHVVEDHRLARIRRPPVELHLSPHGDAPEEPP